MRRKTPGRRSGTRKTDTEPLTRAANMTNARSSKRKYDQRSSDAVLDMIDQRISNLLVRSAEIESKLDSIEGRPGRHIFDFSQYASSQRSKSISGSSAQPTLKTATHMIQDAQRVSKNESVFSSKPVETEVDIGELIAAVKNLTSEVLEMKEEQRIMSDKINEMHSYLIDHNQEAEVVSSDDDDE